MELLAQITGETHLIRERGLLTLKLELQKPDFNLSALEDAIFHYMKLNDTWESKQGAFLACRVLFTERPGSSSANLRQVLVANLLEHMEHSEVRVRMAASETSGRLIAETLAAAGDEEGLSSARLLLSRCLQVAHNCFALARSRDELYHEREGTSLHAGIAAAEGEEKHHRPEERRHRRSGSYSSKTELLHESAGWKSLETALKTLDHLAVATPASFLMEPAGIEIKLAPEEEKAKVENANLTGHHLALLTLTSTWGFQMEAVVSIAVTHLNRFVRETGFHLLTRLITHKALTLNTVTSDVICAGLEDNWSQVRYAATGCVQAFFAALSPNEQPQYFPQLLPRMALNRYYVAEGVKLLAQQCWRDVVGLGGVALVTEHLALIVDYYTSMVKASNHAVREAACHVMAELAAKIDHDALEEHAPLLLDALLMGLRDGSWPVRDAACLGSASFYRHFPRASAPKEEALWQLWSAHLADVIWSVREDAALACVTVLQVRNVGNDEGIPEAADAAEWLQRLLSTCQSALEAITQQEDEMSRYGPANGDTHWGAAHKLARDNDPALHESQQLYSCGSLAPQMKPGSATDDFGLEQEHGHDHAHQPWQLTDGAVYLWRELTLIAPERALPLAVAGFALLEPRPFGSYFIVQETVLTQLCIILPRLAQVNLQQPLLELLDWPSVVGNVALAWQQTLHRPVQKAAQDCWAVLQRFDERAWKQAMTPALEEAVAQNKFLRDHTAEAAAAEIQGIGKDGREGNGNLFANWSV
jgi:hypothetical protein